MLTFNEWYEKYYVHTFDWFETWSETAAIKAYAMYVKLQQVEYIGEI
jgi:hypothetical protein